MSFAWILRKLALALPLMLLTVAAVWGLLEALPGDACDALVSTDMDPRAIHVIRAHFGCDAPVWERFARTLGSLASLDLGQSLMLHQPVRTVLLDALPNTLLLTGSALLLGQIVSTGAGILQATTRRRGVDLGLSLLTLALYSAPTFLLALALQLAFALWWPILPLGDAVSNTHEFLGAWSAALDRARHLVLPATTLALGTAAADARFLRTSMREVLSADFVRTARAKGLPEWRVVWVHGLRNALLPTIQLLGLQLPFLFSGAVVVETVFGWPGLGRILVSALSAPDTPVVLGCVLMYAAMVILGGVLADVASAWADPRVRLRG